jgi:hypothetical protein
VLATRKASFVPNQLCYNPLMEKEIGLHLVSGLKKVLFACEICCSEANRRNEPLALDYEPLFWQGLRPFQLSLVTTIRLKGVWRID